ncbi:hypothetical protein ACFE04_010555 [Oxalis oulophora]
MKNKTACLPLIIYALALAQHHDAIIGIEKQHVAYDYAERIAIGYTEVVATSLNCIAESSSKTGCGSQVSQFQQIDLSNGKSLVLVAYNSLGWKRNDVIRIPVVLIFNRKIDRITTTIIPGCLFEKLLFYSIMGKFSTVNPKYWLAFSAILPPLSFKTYTISGSKRIE